MRKRAVQELAERIGAVDPIAAGEVAAIGEHTKSPKQRDWLLMAEGARYMRTGKYAVADMVLGALHEHGER